MGDAQFLRGCDLYRLKRRVKLTARLVASAVVLGIFAFAVERTIPSSLGNGWVQGYKAVWFMADSGLQEKIDTLSKKRPLVVFYCRFGDKTPDQPCAKHWKTYGNAVFWHNLFIPRVDTIAWPENHHLPYTAREEMHQEQMDKSRDVILRQGSTLPDRGSNYTTVESPLIQVWAKGKLVDVIFEHKDSRTDWVEHDVRQALRQAKSHYPNVFETLRKKAGL